MAATICHGADRAGVGLAAAAGAGPTTALRNVRLAAVRLGNDRLAASGLGVTRLAGAPCGRPPPAACPERRGDGRRAGRSPRPEAAPARGGPLLGVPALSPRRPPRTFRAGPDHRQRHSPPLLVDLHHPDMHGIAHRHDLVRIADEAVGHAADVDQAAVVHADIDEAAEIDDVQDRARKLHAGRQVFQLEDALLEDRRRQVFAGIAAGPGQLREDVLQRQSADGRTAEHGA